MSEAELDYARLRKMAIDSLMMLGLGLLLLLAVVTN